MRRRSHPTLDHDALLVRFAWWTAFLATLALVALLGLARSAGAATPPGPPSSPHAFAAPVVFDEEDEEEADASEDEDFEWSECDEDPECEEEEVEDVDAAPRECLLSTIDATAYASGNGDRVRLKLRYTTSEPTSVTVSYGLHGGKGSLFLGAEKKRFGKRGVLSLSRDLTEEQMAKVLAARDFTVRTKVPDAPRYCSPFFDHHLDIRQATPSGLTWQQRE